uniref:VWFA domain-containing protein n=1 Tax=Candidatus Kentrum eta TaxID=2126337 RepID=A0A450UEX6_9GAMM|nr:MAG: hypothetical protein BECKH772A_GA0070896_100269 [Candidatus Kentron sp. H]VFJ92019.1 MAG: hypothetical protein BECKH772B_GA0070898_100249 [Candidatus Kentron sp. H]VFJ98607.1 MAG: hypothetical protein BECKH772C_GA0070978_100239 [Candidatus Kentron sp. H]
MGVLRWVWEKIKWLWRGIWRAFGQIIAWAASGTGITVFSIVVAVWLSIATNEEAIRSPKEMWSLPCKRLFSDEYFNKDKYLSDKSSEAPGFWKGIGKGIGELLCRPISKSSDNESEHLLSDIINPSDTYYQREKKEGTSQEPNVTHVFILDVSGSTSGKVDVPSWYKEAEKHLEGFGIKKKSIANRQIDRFELAKTYLNRLLASFVTANDKEPIGNMAFAVWPLGDAENTVDPLFPKQGADYAYIKKVIHTIDGLSAKDRNTEFSRTLDAILDRYKFEHVDPDKDLPPSFIVTIISDFFDDPKDKDFKQNRLKEAVEELAVRNIVLNAVVLEEGQIKTKTYFPMVDQVEKAFRAEAFEKMYLLNEYSEAGLLDEYYGRMLYPFERIMDPLYFYYEEAEPIDFTNDIKIRIDFGEGPPKQKDAAMFGVRLPMIHKSGTQEVRLLARIRKNNGEYSREKGSTRWLTSHSYFFSKLGNGNVLEISPYRLSSNDYLLLELVDQSRGKRFLFNVYPKKILSEFVAWLLVGLLSIVILFFPVLVLLRCIFLIGKHRRPPSSTTPRHLSGQWFSRDFSMEWRFGRGEVDIEEKSGEKVSVPYEAGASGVGFKIPETACREIADNIPSFRDLEATRGACVEFEYLNKDHMLATWRQGGGNRFSAVRRKLR